MAEIRAQDIDRLRNALPDDLPSAKCLLMEVLGGKVTASGFWRFFSPNHPRCGAEEWNRQWRRAWDLAPENVYSFGEDLFGNQILFMPRLPNVFLCDHEDGQCHDTDLSAGDLFDAAAKHGVGWLDFYANGAPELATEFLGRITWETHLHWTQPLILGGSASRENISVVDSLVHLAGHQEIWEAYRETDPGDELIIQ